MMKLEDCYWEWDGSLLTVGNSLVERIWRLEGGHWYTQSITNKNDGNEWVDGELLVTSISDAYASDGSVHVQGDTWDDMGIGERQLTVTVSFFSGEKAWQLLVRIAPTTPIIRQELRMRRQKGGTRAQSEGLDRQTNNSETRGVMLDTNNTERHALPAHYVDYISLKDIHTAWHCIAITDRTDTNNNLVSEQRGLIYPNDRRKLRGNLLYLRSSLRNSGLLIIKESPPSEAQLGSPGADFEWRGRELFVAGSGLSEAEYANLTMENDGDDQYISCYSTALAVYDGSELGGLQVTGDYHLLRRSFIPHRDCFIMSNTWGDRNRDSAVNELFILQELEIAASLGITHLQIDDGWQQGTTMNSVNPGGRWGSYYNSEDEEDFWSVHQERFPRGLDPVAAKARELGIRLGLWFSPDAGDDYRLWETDAETLISLYRDYGIEHFKLDGIQLRSKTGERNLLSMMQTVLTATSGNVYFNQDTTNEVRLGYFGQTQYGGLFLENRYTDWGVYYPHFTLRNLWMLARYVPAQLFQMEFLNVDRNKEVYGDDSLAPASCGILYSFAVTMFANPLAWMELRGLGSGSRQLLEQAINSYRLHQERIHSGRIMPIGEEPSGTGWTGFQSVLNDQEGYLLLFRERTDKAAAQMQLWDLPGGRIRLKLQCLLKQEGPTGQLEAGRDAKFEDLIAEEGRGTFQLTEPISFALYRYSISPGSVTG
ncbi:alpha-galactosidase [Paenibacillus swuensis]|uniref:alpha-galactosidase n=1 Tax=Paenibacillus swuensis TaxID=1178515 RepID=UPI0008399D08|nr:alpha-galactosidase [Paenibacillus swuensis]